MSWRISDDERRRFEEDGYLLVEGLLSPEEVRLLHLVSTDDGAVKGGVLERGDASGATSLLTVRNELGDDLYSAIARSRRVVHAMEAVLDGEVYHYHHKLMLKEPRTGGAWEWHQDYGYWYKNGCLFPLMASCMISIDRATLANGCLQVIKGSHRLGRLEHGKIGDQTGADQGRVAHILRHMEVVPVEMEPGTALFFHCNLLHRSARNVSEDPRWSLICCYNAARNDPVFDHHHPRYTPLEVWPDERVLEVARRDAEAAERSGP